MPLQYLAQGAVMAIEDAYVLSEHCRRVLTTARAWGELWHHVGGQRVWRNAVTCSRDVYDYSFVDWLYGPTALAPEQEPAMFEPDGSPLRAAS